MMSRPRGVDVTLEWCQITGVPTTEELMSLLNGVSTRGDLMTHSDGVPATGVDVTKVITMCHFTQCLIYRCRRIGDSSRTGHVSLSMNDSRKPDTSMLTLLTSTSIHIQGHCPETNSIIM